MDTLDFSEALQRELAARPAGSEAAIGATAMLARLVELGLDRLPFPGSGATLDRWRALSVVAEYDLSLAKLYEGHTDALAILHEIGGAMPRVAGQTWGVWAAEVPHARVSVTLRDGDSVLLTGVKAWCSGAASCTHALLTVHDPQATGPLLAAVSLDQPGVTTSSASWRAVGMPESPGLRVEFDGVRATLIGEAGRYLSRPGFAHGGIGVAACWFGAARGIAQALRRAVDSAAHDMRTVLAATALGQIDLQLQSTAALLRAAAASIDAEPLADATEMGRRVRLSADATARFVLDQAGQALGAAAFCQDARFARAAADLPVFIRQCHAQRDFHALGIATAQDDEARWSL